MNSVKEHYGAGLMGDTMDSVDLSFLGRDETAGEDVVAASDSPAAERDFPLLDDLYGQKRNVSPVQYQKEKPMHRRILFLKAQGMSNVHIAEAIGMTPVGVGLVCRQEWFRAALVQLMNGSGVDGVKKAIEGAALDSVFKIIELRDTANSESVKKDCAMDLLDRYLGKAVQPIGSEGKPIADEAKLDAEIAELQKKLKRN